MEYVLASSSPRRKKLLGKILSTFDSTSAPPVSHLRNPDARRLTRDKAEFKAVWGFLKNPQKIVIGADTLLNHNGKAFRKPKDVFEAKQMLGAIGGTCISAYTSVCICHVSKNGKLLKKLWTEKAEVCFKKIGKERIEKYIQSRKWEGKAGGFNIGEAPVKGWVKNVKGDENTVIGLPLKRLEKEIMAIERKAIGGC